MAPLLAISSFALAAICASAVIATVILWTATRPPVLASATLPPVLRRGVYWWLGATCLFSLLALAWVVLRKPLGLPRGGIYRYMPLVLGLMPLLVLNPLYLWRTAWVRRALAAAHGKLCTHCAYNVSGLAPVGTCPECGNSYDADADAQLWARIAPRPGSAATGTRSGSGEIPLGGVEAERAAAPRAGGDDRGCGNPL